MNPPIPLPLHTFHDAIGAVFTDVNGQEAVAHYRASGAEYQALRRSAGLIDLSFRGRLCLTGADRVRLLHGQVTNDIQRLATGEGCYAALVTNKGKFQADANIHALAEELLLDFEPGLTPTIVERLEHYVVADDVQITDVAPHYALFSVQGPKAAEVLDRLGLGVSLPKAALQIVLCADPAWGDLYVANHPRTGVAGFDCYAPSAAAAMVWDKLTLAAHLVAGAPVGFDAFELARFEAGIPRFGVDMDATNLPPEAGLDARAISYSKGCYIGQEVIARIRTYGQVAKALRRLRLHDSHSPLPLRGDKLYRGGRDVGYVTSAKFSPAAGANLALAYVRREANALGTQLQVGSEQGPGATVQSVTEPAIDPATNSPAGTVTPAVR